MKFEKKIDPYLEGTSFSNGLIVQIAEGMESARDRLQIIENLVAGRSVIHVGCVDHIPLLDEKIKKNRWLHARMACALQRSCRDKKMAFPFFLFCIARHRVRTRTKTDIQIKSAMPGRGFSDVKFRILLRNLPCSVFFRAHIILFIWKIEWFW